MGLPCGLFNSGFSRKSLHAFFSFTYACHMPCPPHSPWFCHPSMLWRCKQLLSLCNFLQLLVTPSLFDPNIFLSILFSNILQLCSSFNVTDWILHKLKTTRKITVLIHFLDFFHHMYFNMYNGKSPKSCEFKCHTPTSKHYRTGKIQFCILLIFVL